MTDEDIIEGLQDLIVDRESFINDNNRDNIFVKDKQVLEEAIKLIQKQQKEIERLETNEEITVGELERIGIDTLKLELGSSTDDVIEEIKKKDKIIKEMAEYINTHELFLDNKEKKKLLSTYCSKIQRESEDLFEVHTKCIIKYFEQI